MTLKLEPDFRTDDTVLEPSWGDLLLTMYAVGLNLAGIPALAPLPVRSQ